MGQCASTTKTSDEWDRIRARIKKLEQLFKQQFYQYNTVSQDIHFIDDFIEKRQQNNVSQQHLLIDYYYQKAKYYYYHKKYHQSLKNLNNLRKKVEKNKSLRPYISVLNIKIFVFLVSYFLELKEETNIKGIKTILESYWEIMKIIKEQRTSKQQQMILFVSKLIYHLFWLHRAKAIDQQKFETFQELNKLLTQQFLHLKELVQKQTFMIEVQVQQDQSFKEKVRIKPQSLQKSYIQHLGIVQDNSYKFSAPSKSSIENQKLAFNQAYSQILNQQQDNQRQNKQNQDFNLTYLLQNGQRQKDSQWFPFLNLSMVYISKGGKQDSWIKLFKNRSARKLTKANWAALTLNCMAIQIFDQHNFKSRDSRYQTAKSVLNYDNNKTNWKKHQSTSTVSVAQKNIGASGFKKGSFYLSFCRGISNIGNTCYLNSVLQCLHKSKYFKQHFFKHFSEKAKAKSSVRLSKHFNTFLKEMDYQQEPFNPKQIKVIVGERNSQFAQFNQSDAIEFMSTLLSIVSQELNLPLNQQKDFQQIEHYSKDLKKIYEFTKFNDEKRCKSIIEDTFTGRYKVTYKCRQCKKDYVLFEKFNIHYLQIPVRGRQQNSGFFGSRHFSSKVAFQECDLQDCLVHFKEPDSLTGDNKMTCDVCGKQTESDKVMEVYQANNVLVVGLKRFYEGDKNETVVRFPQVLRPEEIMINPDNQTCRGKVYEMYAAILHSGTLNGGHYVAVCRNQDTNKWNQFNDSIVGSAVSFQNVDFRNAYVVFYQLSESKVTKNQKQSTLLLNETEKNIQAQAKLIQNKPVVNFEPEKSRIQRRQLKSYQRPNIQMVKCVLFSLVKQLKIVQYFEKNSFKQNPKTGTVISIFKRTKQLLDEGTSSNSDVFEFAQQQSRSQLQWAEKEGVNKLRHLIEYYIKTLDQQLGMGVDLIKKYFQITEKDYYKCQKLDHSQLSRKLIHKLGVNNDQWQIKSLNDLIKCFYLPQIANTNNSPCRSCYKSKFINQGKLLLQTKINLIIGLDKDQKKKGQQSQQIQIPKELKLADIISQKGKQNYQNIIYHLSAIISAQSKGENDKYSVQFYAQNKWFIYYGDSIEPKKGTSFPNAVLLFYQQKQ